MKIGIMTFHYAHNYGAVLQAYALKKYLLELRHQCVIIDYRNKVIEEHYPTTVSFLIGKKDLCFPWRWKRTLNIILYRKRAQQMWKEQWNKFEEFIHLYLLDEKDNGIDNSYDVLICGSDQVWGGKKGPTTSLDDMYFLKISTRAKKIAYGVSNYIGVVEDEEKEYFADALKDFQLITTREKSFADSISKIINQKIETVVDPVFLLSKYEYMEFIDYKKNNNAGYILVYFLDEDNYLRKFADLLARKYKKKVIEVHYYLQFSGKIKRQQVNVGPKEFLGLLEKADFVVTNSFHGVAFSIIFEKQFYAFYKEDSRKTQLLESFQLLDRHVYNYKEALQIKEISYTNVRVIMREQQKKVYNLFKESLNDFVY